MMDSSYVILAVSNIQKDNGDQSFVNTGNNMTMANANHNNNTVSDISGFDSAGMGEGVWYIE